MATLSKNGGMPVMSGDSGARRKLDPRRLAKDLPVRLMNLHADVLTDRFGPASAGVMRREILQEYRALVPGLPDIGGRKNPESLSMLLAPWALALYRVVLRHGGNLEDTGEVVHFAMQKVLGRIPRRVRLSMGQKRTKELAEKKALWFAEHRYPNNWVYEVVDGAGQPFDFGLDATQCAIVHYLRAQGADELTPYLCDLDYVMFEAFGIGLTRTRTLAWGCDRCDFRVTRSGQTTSTWPPLFTERTCGQPTPTASAPLTPTASE